MNRKIIFLVGLICIQMFSKNIFANSESTNHHCPPLQFYAGMVGGIDRMNGRRSESLTETVAGTSRITSYTSNFRMLENNAYLSFMSGFLWKLPPLPILIGPEIYLGRGNTRSTITDASHVNPANGQKRLYVTEFARKFFYGGLIRIGYHFCRDYLVSFSLGIDRSQFLTKRYFALDSTVTPTIINRTKGFNGVLFGLGLEKRIKSLIVGIDLKLIQYRRQLTMDPISIPTSPAASNFSARPILYIAGLRLAYVF